MGQDVASNRLLRIGLEKKQNVNWLSSGSKVLGSNPAKTVPVVGTLGH